MVSGWDLTRWEWLEADFLPSLSSPLPAGGEIYRIGYLAKGAGCKAELSLSLMLFFHSLGLLK
jgi:hypothetical protein